jgi:hypothetical protein
LAEFYCFDEGIEEQSPGEEFVLSVGEYFASLRGAPFTGCYLLALLPFVDLYRQVEEGLKFFPYKFNAELLLEFSGQRGQSWPALGFLK